MAKHVLRTWTSDDGNCICIELFDDEEGVIYHYEIPNEGKKVFVKP